MVLCRDYQFSTRRACGLIGFSRSSNEYRGRPDRHARIRERLVTLSGKHRRYGYRMLHAKLGQEGFKVNVKVVERLYREERLTLRRRNRKKIPKGVREGAWCPIAANQRWSLDFTMDALANGRKFRTVNLKDDCTRECPAIDVALSIPGSRVVEMLERVARERGYPDVLTVDNGPELRGRALDGWADDHGVQLYWNVEISVELDSIFGDLGQCLSDCKKICCLEIGQDEWPWEKYLAEFDALKTNYQQYISEYNGGRKNTVGVNDISIIALAKTLGLPVMSMEKPTTNLASEKRLRIPDVCVLEKVILSVVI